jgi:hypothetical protein
MLSVATLTSMVDDLTMKSAVAYIDTNCFLQLRDLKDLPWKDIFPGVDHVALQVAPIVIDELDEHKTSTNGRKRDRSRSALDHIDQAADEPGETLVLRSRDPKITLTLTHRPDRAAASVFGLDFDTPDDQLVLSALSQGTDVSIISHDRGPRLTARRKGLLAPKLPHSWLLPDDQTDDKRTINRLQGDVKKLTERLPQIKVAFPSATADGLVTLVRFRLPELSSDRAKALAKSYCALNPIKTLPINGSVHWNNRADLFTQSEADEYHRGYQKFRESAQSYFEKLHTLLSRVTAASALEFSISNQGGASAKQMVVELEIAGQLTIFENHDSAQRAVGSLEPPKPPQARNENMRRLREAENVMRAQFRAPSPEPSSPTSINWIERPKNGAQIASYGCDDFRPGRNYDDEVLLWSADASGLGRFTITAGASDTQAVTATVEVRIDERVIGWDAPELDDLLPVEVLKLLRET